MPELSVGLETYRDPFYKVLVLEPLSLGLGHKPQSLVLCLGAPYDGTMQQMARKLKIMRTDGL